MRVLRSRAGDLVRLRRVGGPVLHVIKLTETREIAPYKWEHPDDQR